MTPAPPIIGLLAGLLLIPACATGGEEDRPTSEIKISASHHMYGLGGARVIREFPIPRSAAGTDFGVFHLSDQGEYTITRDSKTSSPLPYSLAKDGLLHLVVPVSNSSPTRFVGAYRSGKDMAEVYFFTDRFAPSTNPVVGLFWGTLTSRPDPGDVRDASYYFFSQHLIFSKSVFPDKNDVGRSVAGEIAVSDKGVITGRVKESSGAEFDLSGVATQEKNERVKLTINYKKNTTPDSRTIYFGQTRDVLLGVDEDNTGNKAGLVALVRRRELKGGTPAVLLSESEANELLAGSYHFGMHTIFVAPGQSGIDAANGTIEFNDRGGWTLTGIGSAGTQNGKVDYAGSYEFLEVLPRTTPRSYTNKLTLTVIGPPAETWIAAVDEAYGVIVIVDNEIEDRGTESPELNLILAMRVAK